jgi:hypothetical protein
MTRIAVDIDSTLYDFETPAREAMLKLYYETGDDKYKEGAYHPWTEWRSPADVIGLERWLKAIDLCHDADVIEAQRPFDGAVETCRALVENGHDLLYISNRRSETEDATRSWLDDQGFLCGDIPRVREDQFVAVACVMGDKKPYMAECQYLIDDRLKTCVEFVYDYDWREGLYNSYDGPDLDGDFNTYVKAGERKAFVKAYPYNQAGTDIPGLYVAMTWAGLNEYLVNKGLLEQAAFIPLGLARV